jgi:hypothetical protein
VSDLLSELPGILIVTFLFGGWVITGVASSISKNMRLVRECEHLAALKHNLAMKGMPADEIVKLVNAGGPGVG